MDLSLNDFLTSTPEDVPSVSIEPEFTAQSVNNFSLCMQEQLAQSIDIDCGKNIFTRSETSLEIVIYKIIIRA